MTTYDVSMESGSVIRPNVHGESSSFDAASRDDARRAGRAWVAASPTRRGFFNRFSNVRLMIRPRGESRCRALRVNERI